MKHLCDLSISDIREVFACDEWTVSEKLDGSYMRAGIDDQGRYYTLRKSNARYYSVDDWPDLAWTNSFRSAHVAMQEIVETLYKQNHMQGEFYLDMEIINGTLPNSIKYSLYRADSIYVMDSNVEDLGELVGFNSKPFNQFVNSTAISDVLVAAKFWYSTDGYELKARMNDRTTWNVRRLYPIIFEVSKIRSTRPRDLIAWFDSPLEFRGTSITNADALELKLNKRPASVSEADWKANRLVILDEIRALRGAKQAEFERMCNHMSRLVQHKFLSNRQATFTRDDQIIEGVVVKAKITKGEVMFKMVDKEYFSKVNRFTHIVRYWLQGGRRPERPSFLSRTAHWPVEARLARLNQLRKRYIQHESDLVFHNNRGVVLSYRQWDLHERTITLFAEIRERLLNGRHGVQGQSSTDQSGGDSPDPVLAVE